VGASGLAKSGGGARGEQAGYDEIN